MAFENVSLLQDNVQDGGEDDDDDDDDDDVDLSKYDLDAAVPESRTNKPDNSKVLCACFIIKLRDDDVPCRIRKEEIATALSQEGHRPFITQQCFLIIIS